MTTRGVSFRIRVMRTWLVHSVYNHIVLTTETDSSIHEMMLLIVALNISVINTYTTHATNNQKIMFLFYITSSSLLARKKTKQRESYCLQYRHTTRFNKDLKAGGLISKWFYFQQ